MPLPGFISPRPVRPEEFDALARYTPSTTGEVVSTLLGGGERGTFAAQAGRLLESEANRPGAELKLSADEATRRFGIPGQLTFDRPIAPHDAAFKQANKRDELFKRDILQRNESVPPLGVLALSLGGGVIDPGNLLLGLMPVAGEARFAQMLGLAADGAAASRGAALVGGAARGAYRGAFGGVVGEGVSGALATNEGRDYSLADALIGVTGSAIFGAGFGGALGAAGWRAPASEARGRVAEAIRAEAARQGQDGDLAVRIAQLESGLDPAAQNPASSAGGLFQFMDGTWEAMGGGDKADAGLSAQRGVQLLAENRAALAKALGREPEAWELYLAHQQGAGGAAALLKDPEARAVDVLAKLKGFTKAKARDAILNNGGREDMTAGEFAGLWRSRFGGEGAPAVAVAPAAPPIEATPRAVAMLDEEARAGALAKAVDDLADGRPVEVGSLIEAETARGGGPRPALDEAADRFGLTIPARVLDADRAVTVRGTEIPVRYALVEARDLVPSHDADLVRNPDYPAELQPRERDRAGSQARLLRMEREFNPRRLMDSADAESGAPIIAPDGVVESGNGRTIVLARNAAKGSELYGRYRAALEARGYDTAGMEAPILVRVREQPMSGAERVRLTREMNADTAERYSATEQAFADAKALSDADVGLFVGGDVTAVKNDAFARRFLELAGAGQENDLVDPVSRRLSRTGIERVQAALLARAYGDRELVFQVFETSDPVMKTLGAALTEAAPEWARMRAKAAAGELAEGADTTQHLVSAAALVRHARERRIPLADIVADWRDQAEMFETGTRIAPETEAYLRLFFKDERFRVQRAGEAIATALRDIAARAEATTPGPDLFGESHAFDARAVVDHAGQRLRGELDAEPPGGDAQGAGDGAAGAGGLSAGDGGQARVRPGDRAGQGGQAGADRGGAGPEGGVTPPAETAAQPSLLDDPELKELTAANEAALADLEAMPGVEPADLRALAEDPRPPETVADAVKAAAICLSQGEG